MEIKFKIEFNIGDEVYHKSPDSEKGIIVNIKHYVKSNLTTYLVATGFNNGEAECIAEELSYNKTF